MVLTHFLLLISVDFSLNYWYSCFTKYMYYNNIFIKTLMELAYFSVITFALINLLFFLVIYEIQEQKMKWNHFVYTYEIRILGPKQK